MTPHPDTPLGAPDDVRTDGPPAAGVGAFEALDAATRAIAGVLDVEAVLQVIVDQVRPLVDAQYAALGIVDADGSIERFITSGIDDATRARIGDPPRGHGILGLIIRKGRSFRIADIATDPRRAGFPPDHPPMHAFLGVPIGVKGRSVGNLYLTNKRDALEFSAEDQAIVEAFARHAGIAIENARLHDQVQRLAIVDERERISKDLHDGIIQSIYGVSLSLEDIPELIDEDPEEVIRRVERAIQSLHLTIRDIRNFIFGLRPELLGGTTLADGIRALADEFRHTTSIPVALDLDGLEVDPSDHATTHVLGVVSEALGNVARHSGAEQAWIVATGDATTVQVEVRDDGQGFDPVARAALGHQGLDNMHGRARALSGTLTIDTAPGSGTTVAITAPAGLERKEAPA
jgi:signal transduction histidine kinase